MTDKFIPSTQFIEKLPNICVDLELVSVYDMDCYSVPQLLYRLAQKINDTITNMEHNDEALKAHLDDLQIKLEYLLGEGLSVELQKIFEKMYADGTLQALVQGAMVDINKKLEELKAENVEQEDKIDDLQNKVNTIIDKTVYAKNYETLQEAIDVATLNSKVLELENEKEYMCNTQLILDLSRMRLKGNNAILNFSGAPNDLNCIKIICSGSSPYLQNANFIENLEINGSGSINGQTGIIFESTSPSTATSHLDLRGINIHDFKVGINYKTYVYLVRHYSVDVYFCETCLLMPTGGKDYGENLNFYGCTIYNSINGVVCENSDGAMNFNSCSIDYNQNQITVNNQAKLFFSNGHIEGSGKLTGNMNISNSWLVFTGVDGIFVGDSSKLIIIDNCFVNTSMVGKNMCIGDIKVKFNGCRHYGISDFTTNKLNLASTLISPKKIDLYAVAGTGENTNKLTRTNCEITQDDTVFETGKYSYKIKKQYGGGSASMFRILIPRNTNNTRYNITLRMKGEEVIANLDTNIYTTDINGVNENGVPYWSESIKYANYKTNLTSEWKDISFTPSAISFNDNNRYLAIDISLFDYNSIGKSVWIDRVEIYEY